METIEELERKADALLNECEELRKPYEAKSGEWHAAYEKLNRAKLKRELHAEIAASAGREGKTI